MKEIILTILNSPIFYEFAKGVAIKMPVSFRQLRLDSDFYFRDDD